MDNAVGCATPRKSRRNTGRASGTLSTTIGRWPAAGAPPSHEPATGSTLVFSGCSSTSLLAEPSRGRATALPPRFWRLPLARLRLEKAGSIPDAERIVERGYDG